MNKVFKAQVRTHAWFETFVRGLGKAIQDAMSDGMPVDVAEDVLREAIREVAQRAVEVSVVTGD